MDRGDLVKEKLPAKLITSKNCRSYCQPTHFLSFLHHSVNEDSNESGVKVRVDVSNLLTSQCLQMNCLHKLINLIHKVNVKARMKAKVKVRVDLINILSSQCTLPADDDYG